MVAKARVPVQHKLYFILRIKLKSTLQNNCDTVDSAGAWVCSKFFKINMNNAIT